MFLCVMLLIFPALMETISENVKVVGPAAPLVAEAGEDLVLPCFLHPNISAVAMMVEWIRTDLTAASTIVHLYKNLRDRNYDQMESYRGRTSLFKEELHKGNTSLKLSSVQTFDEGIYQCGLKSQLWADKITIHVKVKVSLNISGPAAPLVVEAGDDLVLPCSIKPSISIEDMAVEWSRLDLHSDTADTLVHLYKGHKDRTERQMLPYRGRTALLTEDLKKGSASLKLSAVQPSDEGAYQCYIEYEDLYNDITVYVEVTEIGLHAWKIAIICISIFSVLFAIFAGYILKDKVSEKELSPKQCSVIAYMHAHSENVKEELDLKQFNTSEEGYRKLIPAITNCRKAQFAGCNLTTKSIEILSATLQSQDSSLKEQDLSNSDLQDLEVKLLCAGLKNSHCKVEMLRFGGCNLTTQSMETLSAALQTQNSSLKELDLSNNDLQDTGVDLLCVGLGSSYCKLEILRLSGCMITEKGCSSLASALISNPSHLKELDLTYNHPGDTGMMLLSARLEDTHCSLNTLRMEHGGEMRIKPGLRKYSCEFTLDPYTAFPHLSLSDGNKEVKNVSFPQCYDHPPERFDGYGQVLCREGVTGRCYWETAWSGWLIEIALSYKSISRKGYSYDCRFGLNEKSWRLDCSENGYSVRHNEKITELSAPPSDCKRVGVYVDCLAGTLSFYSVSSDRHTLTHLHTFNITFTEPLCAGFTLWDGCSVRVCEIE